ncbi:MAG: hypothetical protein HY319_09630 [Armatimonadetes bacterium]|nr:hypothetical protein [Armatimonadota bacterium]
MKVTALPSTQQALPRRTSQPAAPEQEQAQDRSVLSYIGRGAGAVAGGAAGFVGAGLGAAGAAQAGGLMTQLTLASLPKGLQVSQELSELLSLGMSAGSTYGALAGMAAGLAVGAGIAYFAAAGAEKVDDALKAVGPEKQSAFKNFLSGLEEGGAELRSHLADVHGAQSFGEALKSGASAGASFGGAVGAAGGKYQGMLFGAALGAVAALPVMAGIHPLAALPVAIIGGALGMKVGEPVGHVVGSVVGGAVGAVGGLGYHGVHSLVS